MSHRRYAPSSVSAPRFRRTVPAVSADPGLGVGWWRVLAPVEDDTDLEVPTVGPVEILIDVVTAA